MKLLVVYQNMSANHRCGVPACINTRISCGLEFGFTSDCKNLYSDILVRQVESRRIMKDCIEGDEEQRDKQKSIHLGRDS